MAIVFADTFNVGTLTGWGSPNNLPTVNLWGDAGSYCIGCWTGQGRKTLTPVIPSGGAIRAQVACILTSVDATDGALAFGVGDFNGGANTNRYQLLVYLKPNGAFRIRYKLAFPTAVFVDTAAGVFPVDGTQFGLQIRFTIGSPHTVVFTVNNVDVATLSWSYTYDATQWDDVWVYAIYGNTGGGLPLTRVATVDNYEVDSSHAAVAWPAGTAPPLNVNRTCFLDPLDPVDPPNPPVDPPAAVTTRHIRRLRRAPHLSHEHTRVAYSRFELDLERGVGLDGVGQGTEPLVELRCSRDGGFTWSEPARLRAGRLGEYLVRAQASRLGVGRDVVFEVVVSDPVAWSLVGAWLDLAPGTS